MTAKAGADLKVLGFESVDQAIQEYTKEVKDAHGKVIQAVKRVHEQFLVPRTGESDVTELLLDAAAVKYAVFGETEWTRPTVERWQRKLRNISGDHYEWFSEILEEWKPSKAELFCWFATSSRQVPMHFHFMVYADYDLKRVPVAHTCFSRVDIPRYRSKDALKAGLEKALEYGDVTDYQLA